MFGYEIEPMSEAALTAYIANLEPLRKTSRTRCLVCNVDLSGDNGAGQEHHVWPRSYGGTDFPTVMLCNNHHTYIHTLARRVINKLNKGQPPPQLKVDVQGSLQNLLNLVRIIVVAWANPLVLDKRMQLVIGEEYLQDFFTIKSAFDCSDKDTVLRAIQIAAETIRQS